MKRIDELLYKIRFANPTFSELAVGLFGLNWGVLTALNTALGFTPSITLQLLMQLAPDWVWGLIIIAMSFGIILSGSISRLRNIIVVCEFCFWMFFLVASFIGRTTALSVSVYSSLAIVCLWIYLRRVGVLRDIRPVDISVPTSNFHDTLDTPSGVSHYQTEG